MGFWNCMSLKMMCVCIYIYMYADSSEEAQRRESNCHLWPISWTVKRVSSRISAHLRDVPWFFGQLVWGVRHRGVKNYVILELTLCHAVPEPQKTRSLYGHPALFAVLWYYLSCNFCTVCIQWNGPKAVLDTPLLNYTLWRNQHFVLSPSVYSEHCVHKVWCDGLC